MPEKDFPIAASDWAAYYRYSPAALAVRECVRLAAVREIDLPEPILDVGCGDGLFAKLAYPERQIWGIDIDPTEVQRAQASKSYATLVCADVCTVDLPRAFFGSSVANCSLEHVPDIEGALANIRTSLADGAPFVLIVPAPGWTEALLTPRVLGSIGLGSLGRMYGEALDRVFRHHHVYGPERWRELLHDAGFELVETRPLVAPGTSIAFDALLPPSAVGWLVKRITGRWIAVPAARAFTAEFARKAAQAISHLGDSNPASAPGELLLVARARKGAR